LWLPSRKELSSVSENAPGYLLQEVQERLVDRLKKDSEIKLFEELDFRRAIIKNGSAYLDDFCFDDLDIFFWLGELGREGRNSFPMEVLRAIASKVRVVNNPLAFEIGLDKFKSLELLRRNGVAVPSIALLSHGGVNQMKKVFRDWNSDVVIKPRMGSYGIGIVRIREDEQLLVDTLDYASHNNIHYIEQFIPNDISEWIGINVINGSVIYGYGKEGSQIKGWKISDREKKGGHMLLKEPNRQQRDIALRVGRIVGLDLYGVDIIKGHDGRYYVVDVNTFPGLYPELLEKAECNFYEEVVRLLKQDSNSDTGNSE